MKTFVCITFLGAMFAFSTPASAQVNIGLGIRIGPPPAREEVVAKRPPHRGWVWVQGYYKWRHRSRKYVWVRGHWAKPPHPHMIWEPGRWEQRHNEWVYYEGRWAKEAKESKEPVGPGPNGPTRRR